MTAPKLASPILASDEAYRVTGIEAVMTPALLIYPEIIDANIKATLQLFNGDANRWRPHVKTSKLVFAMKKLVEQGVVNFKCATTLELQTAADAGATDILLAYPVVGANARRVCELAAAMPEKRISALVETAEQVAAWQGSKVGLFIDVNAGMNRTGIEQERIDEIVRVAQAIVAAGLEFRGLHSYDGHAGSLDTAAVHQNYDHLLKVVDALKRVGIEVEEVLTSGTPAMPHALAYSAFTNASFVHRISPGTIIYNDCSSLRQLPDEYGYRPAAVVVSAVVSHPTAHRITCDAGHKTVSADSGVPTCAVLGHPELEPHKPSEEHLPIDVPEGMPLPAIGEYLYLVPRHVCPTVNNFDHALIIENGRITGIENVTARGREIPVKL
ncbi:MAG: alanine racemase [Acidobacteria bacterium]|nr:alanine racemase [Acidobacteriota bacterium]